ncbi:MAG: agmatinase [Chloroflexota bacterium]
MKNHHFEDFPFVPAYMGISTFMKVPHTRQLDSVDIAVVGVPFDSGAASWRSGTRFGPRSVRENSHQIWGYNHHLDIAPTHDRTIIDYGDIECDPTNIDSAAASITAEVANILVSNVKVMAIGGDHSITYPLLQAHAEKYGPLAVLHLDSHTDCYQAINQLEHGTPFWLAIRDGFIDTDAYIQVGIRGPHSARNEFEEARSLGAKLLTIEDCFEMGVPAIIKFIRDTVGERQLYVTLDIDSVDPAYAPGTGTPEVGGFTSFQMLQLVRGLAGLNVVGADQVEVNPHYDHGAITSILAANLIFELLSVMGLNT